MFTDAARAIARKELMDKLKSRWILVIGAGFSLFTVTLSYLGGAPSGIAGFRPLDATVASLTSLVTYFIPILALTLGGGIVAEEQEKGTLEIYLASPISVGEFILGKFAGLVMALTLATVIGLGTAGGVLFFKTGAEALGTFLIFILNSVILGVIFLSVSFLVSILMNERSRVIALTIFLWLVFAILYDLGLVGLLIVTKGEIGTQAFSALLMLNPVDIFRIMNFLSIGEFKVFIGFASVEFPAYMTAPVLWGLCMLWIVLPLTASFYFFKKRHLA